ncbi:hypothetical protein N665_0047s0018 [Sinapis alba]|nr:hypothetical protein N665_0047s0018 [Sinapis alba]
MNNYTLKNPSDAGREYMVDKFNKAFNMNITYVFFKNKLDEREELDNTNNGDEECEDGSDTHSGDIQQTQVHQTQEEDEVYRVIIYDDTHIRRGQPRIRLNTQLNVRRSGSGSGSRGDAFDQHNYEKWKKIEKIFFALNVLKGRFYWTCLSTLKELVFWRKYVLDIAGSHDEDKLQLLEAMTSVSRNNEDVPKQLGQCQSFGSPSSGFQQWGTSPNAQQCGTPPNVQQWRTPPNAQQWGIPPNAQQWGTPPNTQRWTTPPNAQQWGYTSKYSTMGYTTNCSTMGDTTKFSTIGYSIKYFTVGYVTKCFTVRHTTECFTVGTFIKISTRRTIEDESN